MALFLLDKRDCDVLSGLPVDLCALEIFDHDVLGAVLFVHDVSLFQNRVFKVRILTEGKEKLEAFALGQKLGLDIVQILENIFILFSDGRRHKLIALHSCQPKVGQRFAIVEDLHALCIERLVLCGIATFDLGDLLLELCCDGIVLALQGKQLLDALFDGGWQSSDKLFVATDLREGGGSEDTKNREKEMTRNVQVEENTERKHGKETRKGIQKSKTKRKTNKIDKRV